jgi:Ion channel
VRGVLPAIQIASQDPPYGLVKHIPVSDWIYVYGLMLGLSDVLMPHCPCALHVLVHCMWTEMLLTLFDRYLRAGYGDAVPISLFGKMLASVVMLFGLLIIALPITVIGSNFSEVYQVEKQRQDQLEAEQSMIGGANRVLATKRSLIRGVWNLKVFPEG